MNRDFNDLSLTELKAVAYDQIAIKERSEKILAIVNKRIGELASVPPKSEPIAEVTPETESVPEEPK